jgi:hypothetical protein
MTGEKESDERLLKRLLQLLGQQPAMSQETSAAQ